MMKWIDRIHEELNLQLDNLPHRVVHACERKRFRQETKIIKEAEDAAKKVKLYFLLVFAYSENEFINLNLYPSK